MKLHMPSLASRRPVKTGDSRSYAATYYHRHAAAAASSGYGCKSAARLTRSAESLDDPNPRFADAELAR
jgi:hypothetical protein